jgi:hypothetical protein
LSLQFHPATGYFWIIPGRVFRRLLAWAGAAVLTGCGTRERLTFPTENPGNSQGPITDIIQPGAADTVVVEGDLVFVQGRSIDPDGIDSVYIGIQGLNQNFDPILGQGRDTVAFAVPLSTISHSGATVLVQIYAVDLLGDRGRTVSRQIHIQ